MRRGAAPSGRGVGVALSGKKLEEFQAKPNWVGTDDR